MSRKRRLEKLLTITEKQVATDPRGARSRASQAWVAARQLDDPGIRARARRTWARTLLFTDDPHQAYAELCTARVEADELNDLLGVAWCDHFLGIALEFLGDPGGSLLHLENGLRAFEKTDEKAGQAYALCALGNASRAAGHLTDALRLHSTAAYLADEASDVVAHNIALVNCGHVRALLGVMAATTHKTGATDYFVAAVENLRQATDQIRSCNDTGREPVALAGQVLPLVWLGNLDEATRCAHAALEVAGVAGLDHRLAVALQAAGLVYVVRREPADAVRYLDHALALYNQWELTYDTSAVLRLLVEANEMQGNEACALEFHKRLTDSELRLRDAIAEREDLVAAARLESDRARRLVTRRRRAERLAHTDALTGLANRRHFEAQAARALIQAELRKQPVSVILLDIDHFKRINDEYGHPVGDRVLSHVAAELDRHCRLADVACRLGGEEFIVLLPDTDADSAHCAAERLRSSLAEIDVSVIAPGLSVTISAGVASTKNVDSFGQTQDALPQKEDDTTQIGRMPDPWGDEGGGVSSPVRHAGKPRHARETVQRLVAAADEALYRAKETGRNRVCVS